MCRGVGEARMPRFNDSLDSFGLVGECRHITSQLSRPRDLRRLRAASGDKTQCGVWGSRLVSSRGGSIKPISYPGKIIEMIKFMTLFAIITVRLVTASQSYGGKHEKSVEKTSLRQA